MTDSDPLSQRSARAREIQHGVAVRPTLTLLARGQSPDVIETQAHAPTIPAGVCFPAIADREHDVIGSLMQGKVNRLELYQSVLLTIDRGMRAPARILFRAFLECIFHFAAIHKDQGYLENYLDQFELQRKKLVNRIRATTDPDLESLRQPINPELLAKLTRSMSAVSTSRRSQSLRGGTTYM